MPRNELWSADEVHAIVVDYLEMLRDELAGRAYSKAEHRRELETLLTGRTAPAIEFKHANISAVLSERGWRYVDGYKPRGNYQHALADELDRQILVNPGLAALMTPANGQSLGPAELGEDAVIASVRRLLTGEGWRIAHIASAALREKGADIEARLGERRLIVEAKGWPASTHKDGSRRKWLPFAQARAYYSNALLPLLIGWSEERAEFALALPNQTTNVTLVDRTAHALRHLGIGVYFVDASGRARRHINHRPRD